MVRYQLMPSVRVRVGVIFKTLHAFANPDMVDDSGLFLISPGIVGFYVVRNRCYLAGINHALTEFLEDEVALGCIKISGYYHRQVIRIQFGNALKDYFHSLGSGIVAKSHVGVYVEEPLAAFVDPEHSPADRALVHIIEAG